MPKYFLNLTEKQKNSFLKSKTEIFLLFVLWILISHDKPTLKNILAVTSRIKKRCRKFFTTVFILRMSVMALIVICLSKKLRLKK